MNWLKKQLKRWVFSEELEDIRKQRRKLSEEWDRLDDRKKDLRREVEDEYDQQMILHMLRRKYKSYNPDKLSGPEDILETMGKQEQMDFLTNVTDVIENKHFRNLMEHLYTRQLISSALDGEDIDAINFGRATINGLSLVEETLERYATLYYERTSDQSDYDEYSII